MDGHPAHPRPNRRHQQKLQTALKPTTCRQRPAEPCGRLSRLRPAHLACWAFVLSTPPTSQRMREWIPLTQHLTHQGTACTVRPRRMPASTGGAPRPRSAQLQRSPRVLTARRSPALRVKRQEAQCQGSCRGFTHPDEISLPSLSGGFAKAFVFVELMQAETLPNEEQSVNIY